MNKYRLGIWLLLLNTIKIINLQAQETHSIIRGTSLLSTLYSHEPFTVRTVDERYQGIKGNPFLTNKYNEASIYFGKLQIPAEGQIKYDTHSDQIICKDDYGREIIIEKDYIDSFRININNKNLTFIKLDVGKRKEKILYANPLIKGKANLYKIFKKRLVKADYQGAYKIGNDYDEFVSEEYYYIKRYNGEVVKIGFRKRSLLKALSDKRNELKNYISANRLDFSSIDDSIRLIKYYNSI